MKSLCAYKSPEMAPVSGAHSPACLLTCSDTHPHFMLLSSLARSLTRVIFFFSACTQHPMGCRNHISLASLVNTNKCFVKVSTVSTCVHILLSDNCLRVTEPYSRDIIADLLSTIRRKTLAAKLAIDSPRAISLEMTCPQPS